MIKEKKTNLPIDLRAFDNYHDHRGLIICPSPLRATSSQPSHKHFPSFLSFPSVLPNHFSHHHAFHFPLIAFICSPLVTTSATMRLLHLFSWKRSLVNPLITTNASAWLFFVIDNVDEKRYGWICNSCDSFQTNFLIKSSRWSIDGNNQMRLSQEL